MQYHCILIIKQELRYLQFMAPLEIAYLCHVVTSIVWLSTTVTMLDIELSEVVEGNDSVEVDDNTCHEYCH